MCILSFIPLPKTPVVYFDSFSSFSESREVLGLSILLATLSAENLTG